MGQNHDDPICFEIYNQCSLRRVPINGCTTNLGILRQERGTERGQSQSLYCYPMLSCLDSMVLQIVRLSRSSQCFCQLELAEQDSFSSSKSLGHRGLLSWIGSHVSKGLGRCVYLVTQDYIVPE